MDSSLCVYIKHWMLICFCIYVLVQHGVAQGPVNQPPTCVDVDPDCVNYEADIVCMNGTQLWTVKNCKLTCGYCNASTPEQAASASGQSCTDVSSECALLDTALCINNYQLWGYKNCQSHCGYCNDNVCQDDPNEVCSDYGPDLCTTHQEWASIHCKSSCNLCGTGQPSAGQPTAA